MTETEIPTDDQLLQVALNAINRSSPMKKAQGDLGEAYAKEVLGGNKEEIEKTLKTWASSTTAGAKGKGKAANIPDWLIMEDDKITHLVEVKAVTSDLKVIQEDQENLISAWKDVWNDVFDETDELPDTNQANWQDRIKNVWRNKKELMVHQTRKHIERAIELAQAGEIILAEQPKVIIFVPENQDFGEWPSNVRYRDQKNEVLFAPLEIKLLPSLDKMTNILIENDVQTHVEEVTEVSQKPDQVVKDRKEKMHQCYDLAKTVFSTQTLSDTDTQIAQVLLGKNTEIKSSEVLNQLSSTAPCLTAHCIFEAAGSSLPGISKPQKDKYSTWLRGKNLEPDNTLNILQALNKMQSALRKSRDLSGTIPDDLDLSEHITKSLLT